MTKLIENIKQGNFLSVDTVSINENFAGSDSEELFLKNSKTMHPKSTKNTKNTQKLQKSHQKCQK